MPDNLPRNFSTQIDKHGRIVIPAQLRNHLGLDPRMKVLLIPEDDQFRVVSVSTATERLRGIVRRELGIPPERSIVDEFIAEKRAEAARE
jgi:bifunctional DNA-binding transcriptional regulator/antitoxin component of YhaV-PrlF toxin-antitoxin module